MIRGVVNRSVCLRSVCLRHVSLRLRHVCSCCYWLLTDACLLRSIYYSFIYFIYPTAAGGSLCPSVKKLHFLRHLYTNCIILPRQARDKHRDYSKKSGCVSLGRRPRHQLLGDTIERFGDELLHQSQMAGVVWFAYGSLGSDTLFGANHDDMVKSLRDSAVQLPDLEGEEREALSQRVFYPTERGANPTPADIQGQFRINGQRVSGREWLEALDNREDTGAKNASSFAMPFYTKNAHFLPRQARDKQRESAQQNRERRFVFCKKASACTHRRPICCCGTRLGSSAARGNRCRTTRSTS